MLSKQPSLDASALYGHLQQLVLSMPEMTPNAGGSEEFLRWMGRAAAVVEMAGHGVDTMMFRAAVDGLNGASWQSYAAQIRDIIYRTLARMELASPTAAKGAFIPVGAAFDVFAILAGVLREARRGVLFVDPYLDATVLTDFAALMPEGVPLNLLSDARQEKAASTLRPAVTRWVAQHGASRPIEARQSAGGSLHDRLILIDGGAAWSLSQSLKDIARRSPGSISRLEPDIAAMKFPAYTELWNSVRPL